MKPVVLSDLINEILVKSSVLGSERSFVEALTPRQAHIVMEIKSNAFRNGDLADRLRVEPSTLTRLLDPLVKKGIVSRGLNPDNRREVLIRLTDEGRAILEELNEKMIHVCTQILRQVPEDKLETVEEGIALLLNAVRRAAFHH